MGLAQFMFQLLNLQQEPIVLRGQLRVKSHLSTSYVSGELSLWITYERSP